MVNKKKFNGAMLGNNLKSYFSKPANIITIVFFALLMVTVVIPLISIFIGSFKINGFQEMETVNGQLGGEIYKVGDLTGYHWATLLTSTTYDWSIKAFWLPLGQSIGMALLACLIAVVFGGVVAWFITRSNLPGKKFISAVFVFPYIMPSWSIAMFWENFFKNDGITGTSKGILQALTGIKMPASMVYGLVPCAICLGLHYAPFAYILIGGILRNMDANLEEAATVLKASRAKILWRVTLPIVAPALISTVLLVFSSSISSYTVPFFLNRGVDGTNFTAISIQMRSLLQDGGTKGQGFVMAIFLMFISIAILTLNNWFTGKRKNYTTVTGKSGQVSMVNLGKRGKYVWTTVMVIIVGFFAIVPLVTFALESLIQTPGDYSRLTFKYWFSSEVAAGSNKSDTIGILASSTMWKALGRSLALSLVVAVLAGTAGVLIGYAVARKRGSRLATWVSNLAFFPYLIPSLSFGAVYLAFAFTPGFTWLYNSFFLFILVGAIKFMPFASRTGTNAMLQVSGEIEEAAIMQNVPWWKRMTRVLFPIQKASFMSGYLLPFISCMRELSLFVLLMTSHETLLTSLLGEYSRTGLTQSANAINLLIIIVVLVIQFVTNKLTGASLDKGIGG
ncbi:MAG: iron ABC transporter permease [Corallococcus sp.]|nr:iron ABC transporter permease [Corallococcus sp.]MCM1359602.1 iron ABC transporter permease [Corallococcus sp.]MCM1395194.1 iron ABC transporter permease [Corallococcus sp.]